MSLLIFFFGLFLGGLVGCLAMALAIAADEDRR